MAPSLFRDKESNIKPPNNMSNSAGDGEPIEHSATVPNIGDGKLPMSPSSAADATLSTCSTSASGREDDHSQQEEEQLRSQQQRDEIMIGNGSQHHQHVLQQRRANANLSSPVPSSRSDESTAQHSSPSSLTLPQHLIGMGIGVGVPAEEIDCDDLKIETTNTRPASAKGNGGVNGATVNNEAGKTGQKGSDASATGNGEDKGTLACGPSTARKRFSRAHSQPEIISSLSIPNNAGVEDKVIPLGAATRPRGFSRAQSQPDIIRTGDGVSSTATPAAKRAQATNKKTTSPRQSIGPPALHRESSMSDRLNRLRSSASNRNGRLKKPISRSKSDVSRTMDNGQQQQEKGSTKGQIMGRSLSSSPISKYNITRQTGKDQFGRKLSVPTEVFQRSLTSPAPSSGTGRGSGRNSPAARRRFSNGELMDVEEEEEGDDDVLLLIAKAKAKLEMEGGENGDATEVLAQLEEQQFQQQAREDVENQKMAALASGSSVHSGARSRTSSVNDSLAGSLGGTASLPGAYGKVPGGGFMRRESFNNASISRYSESAQIRSPLPNQQPQAEANSEGSGLDDLDSISSGESTDMSDVMEIEFSQQSFSNHHEDDEDDADKKPAADGEDNAGSVCASLATASINPDKPERKSEVSTPTRTSTTVSSIRRPRRARSFAGLEVLIDNDNLNLNIHASIPSIPSAMASAPSTFSDDDSDNSVKRRRRQRRETRRADRQRSRDDDGNLNSQKKITKPMKDTSTESHTSQLAIAAEVVRSEEEMVQELRQKVEKEILESMAEELIKMEASMSAFSTAGLDTSHATLDLGVPSPVGRRGSRGQFLNRRGQPQQGFEVPPSPLTASMPAGSSRPRQRASNITPNQKRRLRGLNLSGIASPGFLRGASRGRAVKKQKMPRIGNACLDGNVSSSSDTDDDNIGRRRSSLGSLNIVDALEVIPASPPASPAVPTPKRTQSQPMTEFQSASGQQRRSSASARVEPPMITQGSSFEPTGSCGTTHTSSLLSQLRSITSGTPAPPPPPATNSVARQESNVSLPDLAPPPARDNVFGGDAVFAARQAFIRRPSSSNESVQDFQQQLARRRSQSASSYDDDASDERTEYHVLNTSISNANINEVPSDWDLLQLEMAETGRLNRSAMTLSLARQTSDARSNHVAVSDGDDPIITYDDRLPMSWVAPVGLLVTGAVVLGLVLFAL